MSVKYPCWIFKKSVVIIKSIILQLFFCHIQSRIKFKNIYCWIKRLLENDHFNTVKLDFEMNLFYWRIFKQLCPGDVEYSADFVRFVKCCNLTQDQ